MFKTDALEAAPIVNDTLKALLAWAPTRGREGANLRSAVNAVRAKIMSLLQDDELGPPLAQCFALAQATGASMNAIENVRATAAAARPSSAGAITIRNGLIQFCLVTQGRILAKTTFVSRNDVDRTRAMLHAAFVAIQDDVADVMDAMAYRAIVELHAAMTFYLIETARPLPRMLNYRFNLPLPTLTIAQKLYYDAARADELRAENKIVHPAFAPRIGRAMSN